MKSSLRKIQTDELYKVLSDKGRGKREEEQRKEGGWGREPKGRQLHYSHEGYFLYLLLGGYNRIFTSNESTGLKIFTVHLYFPLPVPLLTTP